MFRLVVFLMVFTAGCGWFKKRKASDPTPLTTMEQLQTWYDGKLAEAAAVAHPDNGWVYLESCDAMLWNGLMASSPGVQWVNIYAAENVDEDGRFHRRPPPYCWNETDGDVGSKTTWSRDMGKGLMIWAMRRGELKAVERHAAYGVENNWVMGKPFDDGRVLYTPSTIGELYQVIHLLGGEDSVNRIWPSTYSEGLVDYEAHLQVLGIMIRGYVAEKLNDMDAVPRPSDGAALLDINGVMFDRLVEHSERQPRCPFYEYMRAIYENGNLDAAAALVMDPSWECDYMRDEDHESLAEEIFVASLIMERTNGR